MALTYTYRPKKLSVKQLLKAAKNHHTNLNRFIEDALLEKLSKEEKDSTHELVEKIRGVIVEHMGVKLSKPDAKTAAEIERKYRKAKEAGNWVSDEDLRPERYKARKHKA
jgi:hypothetical protein